MIEMVQEGGGEEGDGVRGRIKYTLPPQILLPTSLLCKNILNVKKERKKKKKTLVKDVRVKTG